MYMNGILQIQEKYFMWEKEKDIKTQEIETNFFLIFTIKEYSHNNKYTIDSNEYMYVKDYLSRYM